jgi:DNA repair protein RecO (recombination protein O)
MKNRDCFLLSYLKYGDYDAVLHCFSVEEGFESFFVKGIYSARNKKKPYLFPLNLLNISIAKNRNSRSICTAAKIECTADYDNGDTRIHSILFFTADFLNQILRAESQSLAVFQEIQRFHVEIGEMNMDSSISLLFRFLKISGISPLFREENYLDPQSGTFTNKFSTDVFTDEISHLWKIFLTAEDPYKIRLKRIQRNEFLDSVLTYYKWHFTGFFIPNSLAVLRQIYE